MNNVFHNGELEVQKRAGKSEEAKFVGSRAIQTAINPMAFNFLEQQYFLIASSVDPNGRIWASPIIGDHGFIQVKSPTHIHLNRDLILSNSSDIFFENTASNSPIGLLFIDPANRRRFRVNGHAAVNKLSIEIEVSEAYGNCPKYIQQRSVTLSNSTVSSSNTLLEEGKLSSASLQLIQEADTFFLGSSSLDGKMDASHRGGNPGFIDILDEKTLRIPDYVGNNMFNTLGNIMQNPVVGLLFIDFENGSILQLTGKAKIQFDQTSSPDKVKSMDTGIFWIFEVEQWMVSNHHFPVKWELQSYSPFNP